MMYWLSCSLPDGVFLSFPVIPTLTLSLMSLSLTGMDKCFTLCMCVMFRSSLVFGGEMNTYRNVTCVWECEWGVATKAGMHTQQWFFGGTIWKCTVVTNLLSNTACGFSKCNARVCSLTFTMHLYVVRMLCNVRDIWHVHDLGITFELVTKALISGAVS